MILVLCKGRSVFFMKENTKCYPLYQRLLSFALAAVMVFGILPVQTRAVTDAEEYLVDHTDTVADPDTVSRPADVYGNDTEHAGKVTVGKSVSDEAITLAAGEKEHTFTPGTDNFIVTVSQAAQIMGLASESSVPVDVVFVLDTSGSMGTNNTDKPTGRAEAMVEAANAAIASLMAANKNNRVGVVAFSGQGAGYGTSNSAAANVLTPLAHYTDQSATNHLRWVNSSGNAPTNSETDTGIGTSYNYIQGRGTDAGRRNGGNGGTNIHAGVALGAKMLTSASTTELVDGKQVTRMPFLVVLSDGQPTFSASNTEWYDPSMTSEQGPGNGAYSGNGFLPALTAAYYKGKITEHYYGDTASEKNRCYIYTIGVGLDSLTGDNKALAQITMDPATYTTGNYAADNAASYWNYGNTHDANTKDATHGWKTYWESFNKTSAADFSVEIDGGSWQNVWVGEGEEGTGRPQREDYYDRWGRFDWDAYDEAVERWEEENYERVWVPGNYTISTATINATKSYVNGVGYNGGIAYNDDYFNANETSEITAAFNKALQEIQLKAMSSPTHVDATFGEDFSGYVTFTDPIGEYMEVKQMYGILANGNLYQGKTFAQYLQNWSTAPQEFKDLFRKVLAERCKISGSTADVDLLITEAVKSTNQAYYDEKTGEYDNSIVWWGKSYTAPGEEDEQVQLLGFADNDTVEFIKSAAIPEGADYVCRSYFFYGTAGNTAANPNHEYLHFIVRVQRSLKAPYQQTVVISAPASLLSVEKVMITETTDATGNVTYSAVVTEAEPARVVYEVGLRSDINAFNVDKILAEDAAYLNESAMFNGTAVNTNYDAAAGTYSFYTNDWNRSAAEDSHHRAMAKATFDAASDNSFYTYTEDTLIYVKDGDSYKLYTGTEKPVGAGYYYARDVYDWDGATLTDGAYAATKRTVYIPVTLPDSDVIKASGSNWVVAKGTYKASSLVSANEDVQKKSNDTRTAAYVVHPHRTEDENNSHYTVLLGNNGKLTLKSADTKTVDITQPDRTDREGNTVQGTQILDADGNVVMVGDILTYTIQVINGGDTAADATVTDTIPKGTELVSAGDGTENNGVITWTIEDIPAGEYVEVSFQVKVTEAALSGDLDVVSIDNTASVSLTNSFSYTTNTTKNPPEGKKVVDTNGDSITDDVEVPDVLVYRIRWHNDADGTADVTITDIIPAGTSYVAGSASHGGVYDAENKTITWTLKDEAAGASGVVSFRVNVNAAAGETIENDAKIKIGDNDPRVTNKTSAALAKGDLVLSKNVVTNGFTAAAGKSFTLHITEIGLGMTGNFKLFKNGTEVDGGITFTNGVAAVAIADGDTIVIKDITAGAIISVTEAAVNGFTPSYTTDAGSSNSEGRVTIAADAEVSVAVTNTYAPKGVQFQLQATKVLETDFAVEATTFGFTAYPCDEDGDVTAGAQALSGEVTVSSEQNKNIATVIFGAVSYDSVGTRYYLLSEINGGLTGVNYSEAKYIVQVDVTDDGSGQLKAAAKLIKKHNGTDFVAVSDSDSLTFTNSYAPKEIQLVLDGTKVLTGRPLKDNEFSFTVKNSQNDTVANGYNTDTEDADELFNNIIFSPITYTAADMEGQNTKTFTYIVTEDQGSAYGMDYSDEAYRITVTVTNDGGQLEAEVTKWEKLNEQQQYVEITNSADKDLKFTNTFTPDDVGLTLTGTKTLVDEKGNKLTMVNQQFAFVVEQQDDAGAWHKVTSGNNTAENTDKVYNIQFSTIYYDLDDLDGQASKTFTYRIRELTPDGPSRDPNMDYSDEVFNVTVTLYQDTDGSLKLRDLAYSQPNSSATAVAFTNIKYPDTISVTPKAFKTTVKSGTDSTDGVPANINFSFEVLEKVTGADGQTTYVEVSEGVGSANGNGTDPNVQFAAITYGNNDLGTHTYIIREVHREEGLVHGIKHDLTEYVMQVTVSRSAEGKLSTAVKYFAYANGVIGEELTGEPSFHNEYSASGYLNVTATKALVDEDKNAVAFNGKTFGFQMQRVNSATDLTPFAGDAAIIEGVSSDSAIKFGTLYYDVNAVAHGQTAKCYYKITEVNAASGYPGVTYDPSVYVIEVTLDHTTQGSIGAAVTRIFKNGVELKDDADKSITDFSAIVFTNTYKTVTGTSAEFEATKVLNGRDLREGEFRFDLYYVDSNNEEHLVDTGYNMDTNDDGIFDDVYFVRSYAPSTAPGTYNYVIKEAAGGQGAVSYDTTTVGYVTVVIGEDIQNATLTSTVSYPNGGITFTNGYTPRGTSLVLSGTKILANRDPADGEFTFDILKNGVAVGSGYNTDTDGDGKSDEIKFTSIDFAPADMWDATLQQYATAKTFVYEVVEIAGSDRTITYSQEKYQLAVTVTTDTNGQMSAAVTKWEKYDAEAKKYTAINEADGLKFFNVHTPEGVSVRLKATKVMVGHDMTQGSFSFLVHDVTDPLNPVPKATGGNAAAVAGQTVDITFSDIGYTFDMLEAGKNSRTFIYSIKEQPTTYPGVTIDPNTYYAKVVLEYNTQTGALTTSVSYHSGNPCTNDNKLDGVPAFVNNYDPADVNVVLYADKTLINKDLQEHEFTFTLKGEGIEQSKLTDANGRVTFDAVPFNMPGTYEFVISESVTNSDKASRYTLDNSFKVIVTVEDNLRGQLVATVTYQEITADGAVNVGGAEFINYYTAPALTLPLSTQIDATKTVQTVDGITYSPAGFQFAVTDTTGNVIYGRDAEGKEVKMIGVSGADGKIVFPDFYFEKAGEYHYWISEQPSHKTGVTDDLRTWEVHILVRYNETTGLLYIKDSDVQTYLVGRTAADGSDPDFVNVYEPDPIKLNLTATKVLEGRELKDREFLFYLMEGDTIVAQGYNDVKGNVTFELTYTQDNIGTHSYSIKELIPENGLGGVTYNGTIYAAVTVKVSHLDDQHKLVAAVGNTALADGATVATGVTITNKYSAEGTSVKVYANKVINGGKPMAAKDYSFTLVNTKDSKDVYTAANDGSGKIEFTLDFDKAGVYTYTMSEVEGTLSGVTYDDATFTVTVTVEDDLHGKLQATVSYENDVIPTFVNEYKAVYTNAEIKAHKTLLGNKLLVADAYTFELERADGVKVTTTNDANGNVVFNLRYDEAGIYTYILREKTGDAAGTTYDTREYQVTVEVTDDLDGKLHAKVGYDGLAANKIPTFVNTYQGKAVPVTITATKTLTGKTLTADAYTFTLTNKDNAKDVLTVKNDAKGNVEFNLTFTEVGTYTYILAEAVGTDANTTYDKTTYTVTIKVTDDLNGNLKAEVTGGTGLVFNNTYTPSAITVELSGEKTLKGRDMKAEEFTFEVRDSQGKVVATAKNTADGKLKFSGIELKAEGKYTFTVTEVKGSVKGMIYDTTKLTVTVEVENVDGVLKAEVSYPKGGLVFKNTYKDPDPTNPGTGDDMPLLLVLGVMLLSSSALVTLLTPRKKRAHRS